MSRPPLIRVAAGLLLLSILVSIYYGYQVVHAQFADLLPVSWLIGICGLALAVGLFQVQQVYAGRNYMRILTAIGTLMSVTSLFALPALVYWVINVLLVAGTVPLFVPTSNTWYREQKAARAVSG